MAKHLPRLLFVGMTANPGGKESFILSAFDALKNDYECWFLADRPHLAHEEFLVEQGAHIARIRARGSSPIGHFKDLRAVFDDHDFDVVWCHQSVLNTIAPLVYARRSGVPIRAVHSHSTRNLGTWVAGALHPINKRRVRQEANRFFACSTSAGEWFYGDSDFEIIANSFDGKAFSFNPDTRDAMRRSLDIAAETRVIAHVARFGAEKNHQIVLSTVQQLISDGVPTVALLIGDGELREQTQQRALELNIAEHVHFLGLRDDVPDLLQAADVLMLPSSFEGLPYSVLEAQAASLPSVVSDRVPTAIDVTGSVTFVPLDADAPTWARAVETAITEHPRVPGSTPLAGTQFDSTTAKEQLQEALNGSSGPAQSA